MPVPGTSDTQKTSWVDSHVTDLVVLLAIIFIGFYYTSGVENLLDINLYDESSYLHNGISIPNGLPSAQDAPLYALWYYLLSFVQHDTIKLYYLNYKAMTVLPVLLFYLALCANSVPRIFSLVLSLGLLYIIATFPFWTKVSHFAVLILLLGFFLSSIFRDKKIQTAILLVTALAISYVRPEYFVSFFLLGLILVFISVQTFKQARLFRSVAPLSITIIPCLLLILSFGLPLGSGNRDMVAFGQHYARNWLIWHNDQRNPWTNSEAIVEADFGDASSPLQALARNPSAIARHIVHNLQTFPRKLTIFLPENFSSYLGMLVIVIGGIAYIQKKQTRASADRLVQNGKYFRFSALLVITLLLPGAISIVLIAPQPHYLLIFGVILGFACTILLFRNTDKQPWHSSYAILALACLLSLLIVRPDNSQGKVRQPTLTTIRFLRTLNIAAPINILEAEGGYGIYIGENYNRVAEYEKHTPFKEFLKARSINMVVLSDELSNDTRFRDDQDWHSFTNDPSKWGFTHIEIPDNVGRSLLVKAELVFP